MEQMAGGHREMNFSTEIDTWRNKVLHSQMALFQTSLEKFKHNVINCRFVYVSHKQD